MLRLTGTLSDKMCVKSGNAVDAPPPVSTLRAFHDGCKYRGSTFGALSSVNTEIAQSCSIVDGDAPNALVRFAMPLVCEFTRLNQNAFSLPGGRWSAA